MYSHDKIIVTACAVTVMISGEEQQPKAIHTVRKASVTDAMQISALYKRVWNEYDHVFPASLKKSRQPSEEEMKEWMVHETYFIAEIDKVVVGVVGCRLLHSTCQLIHMAVDRPHRGKGIGASLVNVVMEFAKKNNILKIWLDTIPTMKEAKSLYEKLGFVKCGHLRKHLYGLDIELYELILGS